MFLSRYEQKEIENFSLKKEYEDFFKKENAEDSFVRIMEVNERLQSPIR